MDARQRVAIVVAHELAHQWFGNLVVCILFFISILFLVEIFLLIYRQWIGGLIYVSGKQYLLCSILISY